MSETARERAARTLDGCRAEYLPVPVRVENLIIELVKIIEHLEKENVEVSKNRPDGEGVARPEVQSQDVQEQEGLQSKQGQAISEELDKGYF